MIARVWKGWTSPENADPYENLLKDEIFPSFTKHTGYAGGTIYREVNHNHEVEFIITNFFTSLDSIKSFVGQDNYEIAVIEPEAEALLLRAEPTAKHYEVREIFQWDSPI